MTVIRVPNAQGTPPTAVREGKATREVSAKEMARIEGGQHPRHRPPPLQPELFQVKRWGG